MRRGIFSVACLTIIVAAAAAAWDDPRTASPPQPIGYAVARQGIATVEDAYRVFVAMAVEHGRAAPEINPDEMCFEHLAATLTDLCMIDPAWTFGPADCLERDVLAYMAASYLGCRPGLVTGMFGMTRRYAHREMLYRGIIAPGAPRTVVTGSELLSVATRVARRYQPHRGVRLTENEIH
jgi:hypothetical protein